MNPKSCAHDGPKNPCNRPAGSRRYCPTHQKRHYRGQDMDTPIRPRQSKQSPLCAHNGPNHPCERPRVKNKSNQYASRYYSAHMGRHQRGTKMDRPIRKYTPRDPSTICAHNGPQYPCNRTRLMPNGKKGSKYCGAHQGRSSRGTPMDRPVILRAPKGKKLPCAHDGPLYPCSRPSGQGRYCPAHQTRKAKGKEMDTPVKTPNKPPQRVNGEPWAKLPWYFEGLGLENSPLFN